MPFCFRTLRTLECSWSDTCAVYMYTWKRLKMSKFVWKGMQSGIATSKLHITWILLWRVYMTHASVQHQYLWAFQAILYIHVVYLVWCQAVTELLLIHHFARQVLSHCSTVYTIASKCSLNTHHTYSALCLVTPLGIGDVHESRHSVIYIS